MRASMLKFLRATSLSHARCRKSRTTPSAIGGSQDPRSATIHVTNRLAAAQSKRRAIRERLPPDARQLVNKVVKSRSTNLYAGRSGDGSPARGFCKDCIL